MDWYYVDSNKNRQPFDEAVLGDLVKAGTIGAKTLLWNESLEGWEPAESLFPAWFPDEPVSNGDEKETFEPEPVEPAPEFSPAAPPPPEDEPPDLIPAVPPSSGVADGAEKSVPPVKVATVPGKPHAPGFEKRELVKDLASYLNANRSWIKAFGVLSIVLGSILCMSVVGALVGWLPIWLGVTVFQSAKAAQLAEHTGEQADIEEAVYRLAFFFKLIVLVVLFVFLFFIAVAITSYFYGWLAEAAGWVEDKAAK